MKNALECGMPEPEFWRSTPYLTRLFCEAAGERERDAYRHDLFTAWHAGAFGRVKRLPSLKKVLDQVERKSAGRRQSPDQMLAIVKAINAAHGGKVVKEKSRG